MSLSPTRGVPQTQARVPRPTPLALKTGSAGSTDLIDMADSSPLATLEATNDSIESQMFKLRLNAQSLDEELAAFEQHYQELRNPHSETWEADILTRLIEVAHTVMQPKLGVETRIHQGQGAEQREVINRAYVEASKRITRETLAMLGLWEEWYYEEVQRFPEVVEFRSPNPFATQSIFAQWIVQEKNNLVTQYALWDHLFCVCYGRNVEECAML